MTKEDINRIIGINESYEMPEKLMKMILDRNDREYLFDEFMKLENDFSFDWFCDYFQEEHGDRDSFKQDFTPNCVTSLVSKILEKGDKIADICAGTGGLTIKMWEENHNAFFYCEEFSNRAIPILIFNMAIRNMNGEVVHCNCLTGEVKAIYRIIQSEKYSNVEICDLESKEKFDTVVMNPPYSLKWEDAENYKNDDRFVEFGITPKQYSDYAFVLHGFSKLKDNGTLVAIVPHGLLFRGGKELAIRQSIIEKNILDSVIGLPNNMFLNTSIPVCLMILKKSKTNNLLVIDASNEYNKGKQNVMNESHIDKLVKTYHDRETVEKYSCVVSKNDIKLNDYNLNIPRYVSFFENDIIPPLDEIISEMHEIDREICRTELEIFKQMKNMCGTNKESKKELEKSIGEYRRFLQDKYGGDKYEQLDIFNFKQ